VAFCKKFQFDGVDIDWEYPCLEAHKGRPEDQKNFTLLLAELHAAAKKQQPQLLITIAGPATATRYEKIEVSALHRYVDWINLMCYNFHGPWGGKDDKVTNHHSALYATKLGSTTLNIDATVRYYLSQGVPKKKLVVGMPLYGRSYALTTATSDGLHSGYNGAGKGTTVEGIRSFSDIKINLVNKYKKFWDEQAKAPYLYDPKTKHFVTYDDEKSLGIKCDYIKAHGLGGAMVWELGWDTRPGWDAMRVVYRALQKK
jgi:chitinase